MTPEDVTATPNADLRDKVKALELQLREEKEINKNLNIAHDNWGNRALVAERLVGRLQNMLNDIRRWVYSDDSPLAHQIFHRIEDGTDSCADKPIGAPMTAQQIETPLRPKDLGLDVATYEAAKKEQAEGKRVPLDKVIEDLSKNEKPVSEALGIVWRACPEHKANEKRVFAWGPPPWHPCPNCEYRDITGTVEMGPETYTEKRKGEADGA